MLFKWEFIEAAMRRDEVGPFTVATVKTGESTWETHVYDAGLDPVDSAVTHCAALVDEQHDDMVAGWFGLCGDWLDD